MLLQPLGPLGRRDPGLMPRCIGACAHFWEQGLTRVRTEAEMLCVPFLIVQDSDENSFLKFNNERRERERERGRARGRETERERENSATACSEGCTMLRQAWTSCLQSACVP